MGKKVSVIAPCYNIEQFIERFFESLENQIMPMGEFEIILIDDCSKDSTWDKICAFEQKHPNEVIAIRNDVNSKQGYSRNSALSYASGEYIAFLDGDDWIEENYLSLMYEKAKANDCDMVTCNAWRDFGDGERFEIVKPEMSKERLLVVDSDEKRKSLIVNDAFGVTAWGKLIRKSLLTNNEISFPEGIVFEDICWGAMLYLYFERVYVLGDYMYHYFVNRNSVVLKKGQNYYRDMFTTNYEKYTQWEMRKALTWLPEELEFDFIVSYYLAILKMFGNHYDAIPVDAFQEMQAFILEKFPNCMNNKYIKTHLDEKNQMQLYFIDKKMTERELSELHRILSGKC